MMQGARKERSTLCYLSKASALRKLQERYRTEVERVLGDASKFQSTHFGHVSRNLLAVTGLAAGYLESAKKPRGLKQKRIVEDVIEKYKINCTALSEYLFLVRNFPQYRDAELGTFGGYFPGFSISDPKEYIRRSKKALGYSNNLL